MSTILITLDLIIKLAILVWILYNLISNKPDSKLPLTVLLIYLIAKEFIFFIVLHFVNY